MNETLAVFGFGSFFRGAKNAQDIDLLLVHRSTDIESCLFAVDCKRHFRYFLPKADIVLLSDTEAEQNQFIIRSGAIAFGTVDSGNCEPQVRDLVQRIVAAITGN